MCDGGRNLQERIEAAIREETALVPYDPRWPELFRMEEEHLRSCLPGELIGRIEHFGSTAVPGLAAKPVIDILVEVTSLDETRRRIVPILELQGYDYFWRPTTGSESVHYAWFIKRNSDGMRTHHLHMVEADFEHWDRLCFRDYLIEHPEIAREYVALKIALADEHPNDRVAYTDGKTEFVVEVTRKAKLYFSR